MDAANYLGWLALGLTPGLGARMAGKLLRALGSPEAISSVSFTTPEGQRLPAAVAQALHSPRPLSGGLPVSHLGRTGVSGAAPRDLRSPRPFCMCAEMRRF
jgi:hypothetical protein